MRSEETDDIFRSAYEEFEQEPSGDAWQKMNARLDGKAVASYKRRAVMWRSIAMMLFLLFVGFILFEKSSSLNAGQKNTALANAKPSVITGKKSFGIQAPLATAKASQTKNIVRTASARVHISRNEDLQSDISVYDASMNLQQDPVASTIPSHTFPLSNQLSMSTAGIPSPRESKGQLIAIQKSVKHPSPWALTGFVTYERANYRLDNDLPPIQEKSLIQEREEHEASFSTGILANRQLRNRWSIETGLIYSNTTIGIKPQMMYASHDDQGTVAFKYVISSGYAYVKSGFRPLPSVGDSLTTTVAKHNLQTISIPFSVRYNISNQKLSFQPGVGVALNFFTSTKVETEIEEASNREAVLINKLEGARPLYLSVIADANIRYSLNNRWSLNFMPMFKYALTPITKDHVVQTFPYSIGVGVGATLKF